MKNLNKYKISFCFLLILLMSFSKIISGQTPDLKIMDLNIIFEIDETSQDTSFATGSYLTVTEFLLNYPEEAQSVNVLLGTNKDLGDISSKVYPVELINNSYYLLDGENQYKITNNSVYAEAVIRINQFANAKYYTLFVEGKNGQVSNTLYFEVTPVQPNE